MTNFKLFSGSSSQILAEKIAQELDIPLGEIDLKKFSCGEKYVRFKETFRGKEVFLIQTGRTQNMDEDLMELFQMIYTAKQSFAEKVNVILPYFAYSRQDKIHEAREGIAAKLFADLLVKSGADRVITVHLHSDQIQGFFDCPVDNVSPRKLFVENFRAKNIKDPVVVSPDAGGAKEAKKFADEIGAPLAILNKSRSAHNQSEVMNIIGDIQGKTPILIDDMVDTGGSICNAKKALVEAGAKDEVYLASTHAIFSGEAVQKLSDANFKEILCTDTLPVDSPPKNFKILSLAPLLARVIKNVAEKESVSKLYM